MRELLEATLEWRACADRTRRLELGGLSLRVTPLAAGTDAIANLCECDPGDSIPEYAARREIRRHLEGGAARQLTIFTDAAHSALVWTWVTRVPDGPLAYRELSFRPGQAWGPLRPVLESVAGGGEIDGGPSSPSPARSRVAEVLLVRLRGAEVSPGGDAEQALQATIESLGTAEALRAAWRSVHGLRVFDPCCGGGGALAQALVVIAAAYEACLERMRSWLDDLERRRPPPRRTHMGDFRRLVARAGGKRDDAARRRFCRELAALTNIFGADPAAGGAAACRRRLADLVDGSGTFGEAALRLRVRYGDLAAGIRSPADLDRQIGRSVKGHRTPLGEEVDLIHRAASRIRRMHLEMPMEAADLGAAFTLLADRLDAAVASIGPRERATGAAPPLHWPVEFEGALPGGGVLRLEEGRC